MKTVVPSPRTSSSQTMQRVKVGMVGLAAVVLLIGLASAIFSAANRERPITAAGAPRAETVARMAESNATQTVAGTNEPLAELGVAPVAPDVAASPAPGPRK